MYGKHNVIPDYDIGCYHDILEMKERLKDFPSGWGIYANPSRSIPIDIHVNVATGEVETYIEGQLFEDISTVGDEDIQCLLIDVTTSAKMDTLRKGRDIFSNGDPHQIYSCKLFTDPNSKAHIKCYDVYNALNKQYDFTDYDKAFEDTAFNPLMHRMELEDYHVIAMFQGDYYLDVVNAYANMPVLEPEKILSHEELFEKLESDPLQFSGKMIIPTHRIYLDGKRVMFEF